MDCYYTAFKAVRENITKGPAPYEPEADYKEGDMGLRASALRFIHRRCVGLRFDEGKDGEFTDDEKQYTGKSRRRIAIPFNMERDIDRLCLERSLGDFLDSGSTEDAYTVYYCYLSMFLGGYDKHKRMIEYLSEYERNGSSLLRKHRDHYVHSVYVFALGLAIYESNKAFRDAFTAFYPEDGENAVKPGLPRAHFFLEFWGLCALFHDIGYPFELPFEQVLAYYESSEEAWKRKGGNYEGPYLAYQNMESLTEIDSKTQEQLKMAIPDLKDSAQFDDLLAWNIEKKLGELSFPDKKVPETTHSLCKVIRNKPARPEDYQYYMDHGYFSALLLFRDLIPLKKEGEDKSETPLEFSGVHLDVLSAILLHNSLFQYQITPVYKKQLQMDKHPLAWLLMVCDELQCWDRTGYGRSSRNEEYPIAVEGCFSEDGITLTYLFSPELKEKLEMFKSNYTRESVILNDTIPDQPKTLGFYNSLKKGSAEKKDPKGDKDPEKEKDSGENTDSVKFLQKLNSFLDISALKLSVMADFDESDSAVKHGFLSSSSFTHLYDLTVQIDTLKHPDEKERKAYFLQQSLEYQLSSINRAKAFAGHLNELGLFYSDRLLSCEEVRLSKEDLLKIAPLEHRRWIEEHRKMRWHITEERVPLQERELLRCHPLLMRGRLGMEAVREHFNNLTDGDKSKDQRAFSDLETMLRKTDGVRIYRLPGKSTE